ncbi:MAG TPA: YgiT-type zinc finger protein [Gemmatimonadaceae bacterium]|jgi:YgiT-type zinc finger domain-containing protein|nr:YgiT-type zinc finger protein [Gemmatimonadaceae bacterium]
MYRPKEQWADGDFATNHCPSCSKLVQTRLTYRTVQLARTRLRVPQVLVDVCSECGRTISVARQALAQFREAGVAK